MGVMFTVCMSTFSWSSLRIINKVPKLGAFVIFLESFVTVKNDLAKAMVAGVIASALGLWRGREEGAFNALITRLPQPIEAIARWLSSI